MLSSYHGHAPLVTLLLQHGADPNRLNDRGQSPLAGAVFKNEREVIRALLAGNADPRIGEPNALDACKVCFHFLGGMDSGDVRCVWIGLMWFAPGLQAGGVRRDVYRAGGEAEGWRGGSEGWKLSW